MKKIALLLAFSFALLATVSVSAKANDSHYDFYGKAGPTIEKIFGIEKNVSESVNYQMRQEAWPDVGVVSTAEKHGNTITVGSHYAEASNIAFMITCPTRIQHNLYRRYQDKLRSRSNDVNRPPGQRQLLLT